LVWGRNLEKHPKNGLIKELNSHRKIIKLATMNITLEYLKNTFALFAEQSASKGFTSHEKDRIPYIISSDVYEFMEFMEGQLSANHLVHRFNYDIRSKSITASLKGTSKEPFKATDYHLPFLHHLAIQENELSAENLDDFISSFLQKHANLLSIFDVVVSKYGATRADTNIRFAVDTLRKLHLIESRSKDNKRSLELTMLGILSLLFMKLSSNEAKKDDTTILTQGFSINNKPYFYWYAPWAITKSPESLMFLLDTYILSDPNMPDIDKIRKLIIEFRKFISKYIEIDEKNGSLKVNPNFQSALKNFVSSPVFNWEHTASIKVLRNGYKKLW
jgi:hypothetical protein